MTWQQIVNSTFSTIALILVTLCVLMSCDSTNRDWQQAKEEDSIESYAKFLQQHQDNEYSEQAYSNLEYLTWERAATQNTIPAFRDYLQDYNDGAHASIARMKIEDMSWQQAQQTNTLSAYKQYQNEFPTSNKLESLVLSAKTDWFADSPLANKIKGNVPFHLSLSNFNKRGSEKNIRAGGIDKMVPNNINSMTVSATIVSKVGNIEELKAVVDDWIYIYKDNVLIDWAICATKGEVILPTTALFKIDDKKVVRNQFTVNKLGDELVHITLARIGDRICFEIKESRTFLKIHNNKQLSCLK